MFSRRKLGRDHLATQSVLVCQTQMQLTALRGQSAPMPMPASYQLPFLWWSHQHIPMIARQVINHPPIAILFFSPLELISSSIVPTMMMTSSSPYIFRLPSLSAAKPNPICPIIVPASVEHIIAVFTSEFTDGVSLWGLCGQYTYPSIGVTTFSANRPKASVRNPIPATTTTHI